MNARKSGERTKVWTWTHEFLCVYDQTLVRESDHEGTKIRVFISRIKKLTFYACRCPLKMKTTGFHESTNPHIKSFLPEVHQHLCTNRRHSLFFAIVSKIQGVYLSALRIKWTSNKTFLALIQENWYQHKHISYIINTYHRLKPKDRSERRARKRDTSERRKQQRENKGRRESTEKSWRPKGVPHISSLILYW